MPRNGSGTFTLVSGNPVVTGTTIESNWANTTLSDIATAMTDSLSRSGQGGMTAALRIADGTQGAPGVGFANETGSGLYRAGTAEVWAVVQGAQTMKIDSTGVTVPAAKATSIEGSFVFNETGADKDARFEGDTDANLLFTDASTDRVGIGTNTPSTKLHVVGDATVSGTVNATTLDLTNLEVTNIKAKDGTASMTLADSTGVATISANPILNAGTANGVAYLNASKALTTGSTITFDGSNIQRITASSAALQLFKDSTPTVAARFAINTDYADAAEMSVFNGTSWAHNFVIDSTGYAAWRLAGSEQMRLTSTGLGIGTSSPAQKLHINNSTAVNTYAAFSNPNATNGLYVGTAANGDGLIGTVDGKPLLFITGAATRATLDSSGNLGLGVTPSAWNSAYKAMDVGNSLSLLGGSNAGDLYYNAYINSSGGFVYRATTTASAYSLAGGQHRWYTAPSGTAGNAISFTQALTLDASGNLLVGGTTQLYGAAGRGLIQVSGSSQALLGFGTTGNVGLGFLYHTGTNFELTNAQNGYLSFGTNNQERARITSGGDLYVGQTGAQSSEQFGVTTTGAKQAAAFRNDDNSKDNITSWVTTTSGNAQFVGFYTEASPTQRGSITYNRAGGLVAYNTTSDYRAKDIIGPVQNPGATIDALKVYEGVMKGATQSRPMLIAHEAQAHAPYAVSGVKDEVNEDGTPKFQQMDVSSLVPLLLAEIQSLRARVAALEAQP